MFTTLITFQYLMRIYSQKNKDIIYFKQNIVNNFWMKG